MQPEHDLRFTLITPERSLVLTYAPGGWKDYSASWILAEAKEGNFGFNISHNLDLFFVKEGAQFLREEISKFGINAEVNLFVERYNRQTFIWEEDFISQLQFTTYKDTRDKFEVGSVQGGLKRFVNKLSATDYEITIPDTDEVAFPEGMRLFEEAKYDFYMIGSSEDHITFTPDTSNSFVKTTNLTFYRQLAWSSSQRYFLINSNSNLDIDMKMSGDIRLRTGFLDEPVNYIKIQIAEVDLSDPREPINPLNVFESNTLRKGDIIKLDYDFTAKSGYGYRLVFIINPITTVSLKSDTGISFSYFGNACTPVFSVKALKLKDLGQELINKIYPSGSLDIPFLNKMELTTGAQLFVTSSDAIRDIQEAKILTSLNDFRKTLDVTFCTGNRIKNNTLTLVKRSDILNKDNEIINLGEVKDLEIEPLGDQWLFNNVDIGYEKQEYDYPLGRQGFPNNLQFTNILNVNSNSRLEIRSPYRFDYTGVHLIRYEYSTNSKRDTKTDNDIFLILAFFKDGKWQAIQGLGAGTRWNVETFGLQGGGVFNTLISPHHNLRRWSSWFSSILEGIGDKTLYYQSSEELLSDVSSVFNGVTVIEKSDETVDSELLFYPLIFKFDAIVRRNLAELMGEDPSGYMTFNYNGYQLKGFPLDIEGSYSDSTQTVTLLAHPDTPADIQTKIFKRNWRT